MSSRVLTGPGILLGPQSPNRGELLLYPTGTLWQSLKAATSSFPGFSGWCWINSTVPGPRPQPGCSLTHPPKPLTHCQRSCCCCPRAELTVPRNNRAISELPSTPAMLPHSSPHPKRQGPNIRGFQGRKSNSTEKNNSKSHRLSCGGQVASLKSGHGIRGGCIQPKHPQPYSIPQPSAYRSVLEGMGGCHLF